LDTPISILAPATQIVVESPSGGEPLWATAVVAITAALLGSVVGGYASFKANESLELSRRRARAQVRRKAKLYTPIRMELVALREACASGTHLDYWLIVRDDPPPVINRPASLHLWKDLVEDGRAATAVSTTIRALLDQVDRAADNLNEEVLEARRTFATRAPLILASLDYQPSIINWVETDTANLLNGDFDDLNVLGSGLGNDEAPDAVQERFREIWEEDAEVQTHLTRVHRTDNTLRESLDKAIDALDNAMRRIADKYENESPHD
jgi:hypothetical protein